MLIMSLNHETYEVFDLLGRLTDAQSILLE